MFGKLIDFVVTDLSVAFTTPNRWLIISKRSIDALNRRSSLGNLWLALTAGIFVTALSIVYSAVFGIDASKLMPHIAIGYVTWQLLSGMLMTMPNIFSNSKSYLLTKNLPLSLFVFAANFEKIEIFARQSIVIVLVCLFFQTGASYAWFMVPVSLAIYFLTGIGLSFLIGIASLKYRDIGNIINSMMTIIFLCTPVLWQPELLKGRRGFIVELNPFYHFIEIIRTPLLKHEIPWVSLSVSFTIMLSALCAGLLLAALYRRRIVFWL